MGSVIVPSHARTAAATRLFLPAGLRSSAAATALARIGQQATPGHRQPLFFGDTVPVPAHADTSATVATRIEQARRGAIRAKSLAGSAGTGQGPEVPTQWNSRQLSRFQRSQMSSSSGLLGGSRPHIAGRVLDSGLGSGPGSGTSRHEAGTRVPGSGSEPAGEARNRGHGGVLLTRCAVVCLLVCGLAAFSPQRDAVVPRITAPVLFDTPEADRVLSALQILPPDNPWHEDISGRPVHPMSAAIVRSHRSGCGPRLQPRHELRDRAGDAADGPGARH